MGKKYNFIRVHQQDWDTPDCSDWIATIDKVVLNYSHVPVILAGHSLACSAVAYWAGKYNRKIKGALLVAPSDTEADTYPAGTTGFAPVPTQKLPFPSLVVASTNDHYVSLQRAAYFAHVWGSEFITIGEAGHINAVAGYGEWPSGLALLKKLDDHAP